MPIPLGQNLTGALGDSSIPLGIDLSSDVLPTTVLRNIDFTCNSPRYAMANRKLLGPFANNVLAKARVGGRETGQFEEARTNEFTYSEQLDHSDWTTVYISDRQPNVITAPNGSLTADKIIPSTDDGAHRIRQQETPDGSSIYTISGFIKSAGYDGIRLWFPSGEGFVTATADFDVIDGTVIGTGGTPAGYGILPLIDGWYFVYLSATSNAAAASYLTFGVLDDGQQIFSGDGTKGLYMWGMQMEKGAFPSSLIKTTTAPVTRLKTEASWAAAKVPAVIRDGKWAVDVIPHGDSSSRSVSIAFELYDPVGGVKYVLLRWTGTTYEVRDDGGSLVSRSCTYSHNQKHTIILDAEEGSVELRDVTTGVGKTIGTPWTGYLPTTSKAHWGENHDVANHYNGKISEPYQVAA